MQEKITYDMIEYISILAKLDLSKEEKEEAKKDMEQMLSYVNQLKELDTEGVEPMSHIFPIYNAFREDVVLNGNQKDEILKNAPKQKNGSFLVPKTIE